MSIKKQERKKSYVFFVCYDFLEERIDRLSLIIVEQKKGIGRKEINKKVLNLPYVSTRCV
jgi:hypothetical protein